MNVLIAHLVIGAVVLGVLALFGYLLYDQGKEAGRASKPVQYTRVYAYLQDDTDRIAESLYPTLITNGAPADLKNAASIAYARAQALVAFKKQHNAEVR